MKRALFVVLELVVFLVVFLGGTLMAGFNGLPKWSVAAGADHIFVLDGLVFMLALYVLLLLIAAVRRRIATGWQAPTLALVLALVLGLLSKFGFQSIGG
jgi:hypothetical protein